MSGRRYVIVGDGAAGLTAARHIRERDLSASITMVAEDPHPAYYRAALTNYLLGELRDDQLWAVPPGFFTDHRVHRRHARAVGIDVDQRKLRLHDGTALDFDAALVASGARARRPSFPGADLAGVTTLRTLQDAQAILDAVLMRKAERAVVIGGGPLAVELATALCERRLHTTLVVRGAQLLSGALDDEASDLVLARLRQLGVDVRTNDEVEAAIGADGALTQVRTRAGATLPCTLLGVAIGVRRNSEWLEGSGVALDGDAVTVDRHMATSAAGVWAAGDVAKPPGPVLQLWEPAQLQGRSAAAAMVGAELAYVMRTHYFATRLGDLDFASVGNAEDRGSDDILVGRDADTPGAIAHRKLWLKEGRLVGAVMLGHRSQRVRRRGRIFRKLIDRALDVSEVRDRLLDPHFDVSGWMKRTSLLKPRPAIEVKHTPAASAVVRGTQQLHIGTDAPNEASFAPTVESPQLSIGFRSPVSSAPPLEEPAGHLESATQRHPIELKTVVIGRGRLCDIVLADPAVSHRHASISRKGDVLFLRDLGSRHGTWVNGGHVTTPHVLEHGDRLRMGASDLTFKASHAKLPSALPPSAATGRARLCGMSGPCLGLAFELAPDGQTTLGRDASATVRLDDISVSRRHALVSGHQGTWTVCDLHSSRGTQKNGRQVEPGHDVPLSHGDELQLGDTVLRFEVR